MTDAFTLAVQSMQNDMQRLDAISQNVANSTTPGYRRTLSVARTFDDVLQRATLEGTAGANLNIAMPTVTTVVDESAGPLRATGKALDLALEGDGYFELSTPQGPAYTRAGDFHLDSSGRLVNQDGFAVNGQGGDIVVTGKALPVIAADGTVSEGDNVIGRLNIVAFTQKHAMQKLDGGLLQPAQGNVAMAAPAHIRAGYLEGANVVPLREMVSMLETTRHFESQQKLFQGYDEQLSNAIQKLGQF